jgi:hypothetical protein
MRAEPWLDEIRHGINQANSFGCDYCATTRRKRDVACWQILLQKSFWGGERKFLEPLMRFTRGDVRDHIVSSKIDHGSP